MRSQTILKEKREYMEQEAVNRGISYTETTRKIVVTVEPDFLAAESDVSRGRYAFSYTVTLENSGTETVQLVNRHWIVLSGGKQHADVKGEGVVGEQPILEPGDIYRYSSGSVIKDAIGAMYGSYTFRSLTGEFFDVVIPKFDLVYVDSSVIH